MLDADPRPLRVPPRRQCQGWQCTARATWNRWAGFYCYDHAIRAGWLPGPVEHRDHQRRLAV